MQQNHTKGAKMPKNILLTGSGGFIGGNLKEFLINKYNILAPRSYKLNLCDTSAVKQYFQSNDVDFIIHCSSTGGIRGINDKDTTVEDNLAMIDNILKFKETNTRVILFGSGAMYDRKRELHKVKEDEIGKFVPTELYGKSKMLISQKIKVRNDVLCLNIFGCYGKNEKESRFPTYAIYKNLKHEKIEINQNVTFDYLYIDDLCRIIEHFIENKPEHNIINITPTQSITLSEIAQIINEISDFKSEIIIKNLTMNFEYTGDNSILLKELGNFDFTDYKDGLAFLHYHLKTKLQKKISIV